jgi:hypothetical protein
MVDTITAFRYHPRFLRPAFWSWWLTWLFFYGFKRAEFYFNVENQVIQDKSEIPVLVKTTSLRGEIKAGPCGIGSYTEIEGILAMKQKYLILKDKKNKQFKIQEFAELDKESLSLLCEETYDYRTIKSAVSTGKDALIAALRTNNMYPPGKYAEQIAEAVIDLHASAEGESVELFFNDISLLTRTREAVKADEVIEDDTEDTELDEMLTEDFDDAYPEKEDLDQSDSSLQIEDDDYIDTDEPT